MKVWGCVTYYGVAVCIAVMVGALLGNYSLFQQVALGKTQLSLAHLIQFVAYTGALVMVWMWGYEMSMRMPKNGKWSPALRPIMTPLATFVVVVAAYSVIPLIGSPYMSAKAMEIYNWVFIVGMLCAALWLTFSWVVESGAALHGRRRAS